MDRLTPLDARCMVFDRYGVCVENRPFVHHLVQVFGHPLIELDLLELLQEFLELSDVRTICTESLSGPVDLDAFRRSWAGLTRDAARQGIADGHFTALTYLMLDADSDITLWGVDDMPSYERAVEITKEHRAGIDRWERLIGVGTPAPAGSLRAAIRDRGIRSSALGEFLEKTDRVDLRNIVEAAKRHGLPLTNVVAGFARALELEKEIDFETANAESQEVVQDVAQILSDRHWLLARSLDSIAPHLASFSASDFAAASAMPPPDSWRAIASKLQSTPAGRIIQWYLRRPETVAPKRASLLEIYDLAFDAMGAELLRNVDVDQALARAEAREKREDVSLLPGSQQRVTQSRSMWGFIVDLLPLIGRDPESCPNLVRYCQYLEFAQLPDLQQGTEELHDLRQRLAEMMCESEADREALQLDERLDFIGRLLTLQMVPLEATHTERMHDASGQFRASELIASARRLLGDDPAVDELASLEAELDQAVALCTEWYELHVTRANAMARKTLESMRYSGAKHVLLLTGGFHRDAIGRYLRNADCAFTAYVAPVRYELSPETRRKYRDSLWPLRT